MAVVSSISTLFSQILGSFLPNRPMVTAKIYTLLGLGVKHRDMRDYMQNFFLFEITKVTNNLFAFKVKLELTLIWLRLRRCLHYNCSKPGFLIQNI